jgi:hypothetical protein
MKHHLIVILVCVVAFLFITSPGRLFGCMVIGSPLPAQRLDEEIAQALLMPNKWMYAVDWLPSSDEEGLPYGLFGITFEFPNRRIIDVTH